MLGSAGKDLASLRQVWRESCLGNNCAAKEDGHGVIPVWVSPEASRFDEITVQFARGVGCSPSNTRYSRLRQFYSGIHQVSCRLAARSPDEPADEVLNALGGTSGLVNARSWAWQASERCVRPLCRYQCPLWARGVPPQRRIGP